MITSKKVYFCGLPCQGAERLAARGCEQAMRSIDGAKRNLSATTAAAADSRLRSASANNRRGSTGSCYSIFEVPLARPAAI